MQASHTFRGGVAIFDEQNLVSCAGLVPVMELAEQAGLSQLLDEHVRFVDERVASGAANTTPKLASIIAGMAAGADSIDDLDLVRAGGTKKLFDGVYAAATLGILLRELTQGPPGSCMRCCAGTWWPWRSAARCCAVSKALLHRHRLAAAAGVRVRQAGRVVRAHQDFG